MFIPPFCPNSSCYLHSGRMPPYRWYTGDGHHHTKAFGQVQRFRCLLCGKTFSTQTFSVDYYAKKTVPYEDLRARHSGSMCLRAIARSMGLSTGSVQNRLDRLARQAIAAHAKLRPSLDRRDPICIDGFVSFDTSQYFPSEVTISVTSSSQVVLDLSHATHRRSGVMTEAQKERAELLYEGFTFEHDAVARTFKDVFDISSRERPPERYRPFIVITDEKREYQRVVRGSELWLKQDEEHRVIHLTVPSILPRNVQNPLFPSNYIDREIRKDQANHHRETTCFNRSVANGMGRLALYLIDHNYRKKFRIKAPVRNKRVHGEVGGIPRALIDRVLRAATHKRAFLSRLKLEPCFERIWKKDFLTPGMVHPEPLPAYALG